uniref:4-coumarate--CoA ligase n=1 Tax=Elaeis guineensis var. tenera TaxID=51953 RepID=A0A8N4IIJ5_ELAGV|nr:probable acyl-activating enzyme 12, peroxisomal [Elaeis guineensis]
MDQLLKCPANYVPLSPVTFLSRAAAVYPDRTSIVYERTRFTWKQTNDRCLRMASSLRSLNVSKNDVVSVLAPNIPAMYEMHFAVPMAGAVLNAINTRLDAANVATILKHSEAKMFFVDYQCVRLARDALKHLIDDNTPLPLVVMIDDIDAPTGIRLGELEYEQLIARGDPTCPPTPLYDEWDPIALNYTSGTTSAPKGVVYSHRGAFLSTLSLLLQWEVGSEPVYLWSLPMFHCNGWTFTWGMAARGGANVCLRPPPAPLLEKIEHLGFRVTHAYGLTEATGPALVCEWREEWNRRPVEEQARLKARQGISVLTLADVDVKDLETMQSISRDGKSLGEIVLRGSSIMKGYYKNRDATDAAFRDGWFLTGDVGVIHPDGYVEIKDRSKDVIISGGENISSVEVETILYRHPMVLEAAVVAMPHPHWGETPCAFLKLKKDCVQGSIKEEDIISYCRNSMSRFMVPKKVVFMEELPKTSTGKIQKFQLREMARGLKATDRDRTPQGGAAPQGKVQVVYVNGNNGHGQPEAQEQVLAMSRL